MSSIYEAEPNTGIELSESGETPFAGFGPKQWIEYYESLNKELPVDKCQLNMTEEEKRNYVKALAFLKNERKAIPGLKYEIQYKDFE